MSTKPVAARTPLQFYVLPRNVVIRIFTLLPMTTLLTCQQINKRFRTLICRTDELRPHLFLEPPSESPPGFNVSVTLHPVFARLNFFAYHSAKAIRIGEGLDSIFLQRSSVREQFATTPGLKKLIIRVVSGGAWPYDSEVLIENEKGATVWDVVQGISAHFNRYEGSSFGDHFGLEACEQRNYDPKALMQNYEFLNPDLQFPTIIFPDRNCKSIRIFIADYAFNTFAALPLVKLPEEWHAATDIYGIKPEESIESKLVNTGHGSFKSTHRSTTPLGACGEESHSDSDISFRRTQPASPMILGFIPEAVSTKLSELTSTHLALDADTEPVKLSEPISPMHHAPQIDALSIKPSKLASLVKLGGVKNTPCTAPTDNETHVTSRKPKDWEDAFA